MEDSPTVRTMNLLIRPEQTRDHAAIAQVTRAAFAGNPYSQQTEAFIIEALRAAGALALSLVADHDGQVVGHVAFSHVDVSDGSGGWYGLGPISVFPPCQRSGIGSALIERGLADLRARQAAGCVLLGEPAYYGRFGFRQARSLRLEGVPPEYFLVLPLAGEEPSGAVAYHPGFSATA
jgi:putative acetyltransferase